MRTLIMVIMIVAAAPVAEAAAGDDASFLALLRFFNQTPKPQQDDGRPRQRRVVAMPRKRRVVAMPRNQVQREGRVRANDVGQYFLGARKTGRGISTKSQPFEFQSNDAIHAAHLMMRRGGR